MNKPLVTQPIYVMSKPAGPACNLACKYCYYLEKKDLFSEQKRTNMTDAMLERFIKQYIEAQPGDDVCFTWHGGETLLRSIDFYRKAIELQKQYGQGKRIFNSIQTNGTLLNPEWCKFFRDNGWLVGISIDGPAEFHDEYRTNVAGKPTHLKVLRGIRLLQQYNVEWNAMAVVNDYNADYPREFYNFFKKIGCKFIQFTPIVERINAKGRLAQPNEEGEVTSHSVTPEQWGNFLCGVFDEWLKEDVGKIFVQIFDSTLANYVGEMPGVCSMAPTCGHAAVMEYNGDVFSCDHFVFPEHKLGNISTSHLIEMMNSDRQLEFGASKWKSLPSQCRNCKFLKLCNGECPKNRFLTTSTGEKGLNYLCKGYQKFFAHSAPVFEEMAKPFFAEKERNKF